jgi:hypothetical protein
VGFYWLLKLELGGCRGGNTVKAVARDRWVYVFEVVDRRLVSRAYRPPNILRGE